MILSEGYCVKMDRLKLNYIKWVHYNEIQIGSVEHLYKQDISILYAEGKSQNDASKAG